MGMDVLALTVNAAALDIFPRMAKCHDSEKKRNYIYSLAIYSYRGLSDRTRKNWGDKKTLGYEQKEKILKF